MENPSRISSVTFYVVGDTDNKMDSSVTVTQPTIMKSNNLPATAGVYDAHMGTPTDDWGCLTCKNAKPLCPGHSGIYRFRQPTLHPLFIQYLIEYLKIVCPTCGDLIHDMPITDDLDDTLPVSTTTTCVKKRTTCSGHSMKSKKNAICKTCGGHPLLLQPQKTGNTNGIITVFLQTPDGAQVTTRGTVNTRRLMPAEILAIMSRVSDENIRRIGRLPSSHPMKLVMTTLRVLPNTSKPHLEIAGNIRKSTDPITSFTANIIKADQLLPTHDISGDDIDRMMERDNHIREMILPSKQGADQKRSLTDRQKEKFGRIRGNLGGKRVGNAARSTLSGNNMLPFDWIGIPRYIAERMSVAEVVREHNIDILTEHVNNGVSKYPGCSVIIRNGHYISPDNKTMALPLEYGDRVMRHYVDGDMMYFNRQPTNNVENIMAFVIKVHNDDTIQMNVNMCQPFAADFDGDAGNLWGVRNTRGNAEFKHVSAVNKRGVSQKTGLSLRGFVQDAIRGCALISFSDVKMSKHTYLNTIGRTRMLTNDKSTDNIVSGRTALSYAIPPVNFTSTSSYYKEQYKDIIDYNPDDTHVVIKHGKLISGVISGTCVGQMKTNSLFRHIQYVYSDSIALDTAYNMQQIASNFLLLNGASVSIDDVLLSADANARLTRYTDGRIKRASLLYDQLMTNTLVPPIGISMSEFYEYKIGEALASDQELYDICMEKIPDIRTNGFYQMTASGSKGTDDHLIAVVGVKGKTTSNDALRQFAYRRTSPYFQQFAINDAHAYGYTASSYMRGIPVDQLGFDAANGRFAFTKSAIETARVGATARLNRHCLNTHIINNHMQITKGTRVVQFLYGGDGFDLTKIMQVKLPLINLSRDEFLQITRDGERKALTKSYDRTVACAVRLGYMFSNCDFDNRQMPFKFTQIYYDTHVTGISGKPSTHAIKLVDDFVRSLPYVYHNDRYAQKYAPPKISKKGMQGVCDYVRLAMCMHELETNNIPDSALPHIFDTIKMCCMRAFIAAGSVIGQAAALGISEPWVQYTLASKRRSGTISGTQTDKLQRMIEVLFTRSADKMSTPHMTLFTREDLDNMSMQKLAHRIIETKFGQIISWSCELYEPADALVYPEYKHEQEHITRHIKTVPPTQALSGFCYRLVFSRADLSFRNIDVFNLQSIIAHAGVYPIMFNVNAPELVMRIYVYAQSINTRDIYETLRTQYEYLTNIRISGIPGIMRAYVNDVNVTDMVDGKITTMKRFCITTDGTNLRETLFRFPEIDQRRSTTDSIHDIADLYGITAGMQKISTELTELDDSVHIRHYAEMASELCFTGALTPADVNGIRRREPNDALMIAGVSDSIRTFTHAAVNNMHTQVDSISANLLLGQIPNIGTHYNSRLINKEFVKANHKNVSFDDF